jgi:hypothetical protein
MADRLAEDESRFVTSIAFSEAEVCGQRFMRDFTAFCRKMSPLVEFTRRALGQKYRREGLAI